MTRHRLASLVIAIAGTLAPPAAAQQVTATAVTPNCPSCPTWNAPQAPFRVFGNTYYVGTHGLTALLVTSPAGHVLIDGALPESAAPIAASIRALGFRVEDVKVILNSHVHFDHAGGIAELQRRSGAEVIASTRSAPVLRTGEVGRDDPQYGALIPIAPAARVREIPAGDTVRVGPLVLRALRTAGHTPGGTSWSWTSCEGGDCRAMVYGDSQSAISADGFLYTRSPTYPEGLADFAAGFAALESAACDILVTPHPEASGLWERLARREAGERDALRDVGACKRYAAGARERLAQRVEREKAAGK
ncbi:MAG TPA: subclass B3 metallo-beta-lactamase [Gemmatimonadaceae bacterium]|nr:subclass B3 metallo-beta-lactamase [Gemmatimonadaceae bacterium]